MTISGKDSGDSPVFRMSRVQDLIPRRLGGILTAVVLLILAWISVTSVPTGNVGVLTLFAHYCFTWTAPRPRRSIKRSAMTTLPKL